MQATSELQAPTPVAERALHPRQLRLGELTPGDVERWETLARGAAEPNPFFEPAFVLPAVEHLGEPETSLLVVEDEEAWRACLPVRTLRIARLPAALRTWRHLYCFLGTPLVDPAAAVPAARSLLGLALDRGATAHLALERLTDRGPVARAIRAAAGQLGLVSVLDNGHERALLERRSTDDYLDSMRSHHRRELNRLGRRLEAALGGELTVTDEAGDEAALDAFLELERKGWKGRRETALASTPAHTAFFRDVCRGFAGDGRLQLLALYAGKRRVAMKCNLYSGEGGFCFKIAHDEELARFSPGVQLERENVRIFHDERNERWQDSCADPDNTMINRLWPDRRRLTTTVLARGGVRAAVSRRGLRAAQAVRTRERRRSSARS